MPMSMNLGAKSWSPETEKCLIDLNLFFSACAESYRNIDVLGAKATAAFYSEVQEKIAQINRGGPSELQKAIDVATTRATELHQSMRATNGYGKVSELL